MKKFFALLAVVLAVVSCQKDVDVDVNLSGDLATISVVLPEDAITRAGGTDSAASGLDNTDKIVRVVMHIYDEAGRVSNNRYVDYLEGDARTVNFDIRLVPNRQYTFVAWADQVDNKEDKDKYFNTSDLRNVTLATNSWTAMNEERDAFTATHTEANFTSSSNITLKLIRPFAKLRVVATDMEFLNDLDVQPKTAKVSYATKHYNAFNAVAGVAINKDNTGVEHEYDIASYGEDWENGADMTLFTDYFFAADQEEVVNFTLKVYDQDGVIIGKETNFNTPIPVKRNNLTTISGNILTDGNNINVVIDPDFIDSPEKDYIVSDWDGKSVETPTVDANNVISISSAAELVGLMEVTGNSIFIGKTIELQCNIDLGHHRVKGIGSGSNFAGVFDGKGFTISNFEVDARDRSYYAGLFNQVSHGGTIKNLTVANATIKGNSMVGAVASSLDSDAVVENCKAINCTLIGVKKVGSVVGYSAGSTVKDNYAENCVVEYYEKEAGEVLGFEYIGSTVSGNTFNNITFIGHTVALQREMTPDANGVITLNKDYIVDGNWTSLALSGDVTIEGNGHIIKGINQPLVAGTGGINITVNDLTITESEIGVAAKESGLGTAAFISYIDYSGKASFNNCHLLNSKVTGNERAAALVAFSEASEVSIKNCSVVKCEFKAVGGAAGLVAYTHSTTTVENSKVENTTVEATEDRTGKKALAGAVIGTVNANTTFTNVTVSGNTVKNNNATAESDMVGRVVSGTLTVN